MTTKLRIGYVPEHFSIPIHFAYSKFGLSSYATLHPVPSGTGHMIEMLGNNEIDVGIGLTEGFVAGFAKQKAKPFPTGPLKIVGTYVQSPLCWAISTGAKRSDITDISSLQHKKVGVSRLGSGSHIMSTVLADQQNWLPPRAEANAPAPTPPFTIVPCGPFQPLRAAVNADPPVADFFMWEHFTTKRFFDNGELKRVGEIYTPWSSWKIAVREPGSGAAYGTALRDMLAALNKGVAHFRAHGDEAVALIAETMEYSEADARAWMQGVRFADDVGRVDREVIEGVVATLDKAGVLDGRATQIGDLVAVL